MLAAAVTNADGRTDAPLLEPLEAGTYELRFAVGDYFAAGGEPPFLDVVPVRFGVSDPGAHHHVPLLVAPGGVQHLPRELSVQGSRSSAAAASWRGSARRRAA